MVKNPNPHQKILHDAKFKIVVLGDAIVGKTSLIHNVLGDSFDPTLISTIGIDFEKKLYQIDGYNILLEIWDTAGQEKFRSFSTMHFRDAKGFIVVYDTTKAESFYRIKSEWLPSIDNNIAESVPVFIVGNKVDLSDRRTVTREEGEKLAYNQCTNGFFETSAKTGENVQNLFMGVAEAMIGVWGVPKRYYEQNQTNYKNNNVIPVNEKKTRNQIKLEKLKEMNETRLTCCVTL